MDEIEKKFTTAIEEVGNSTWGDKVPDNRKLLMYAYYKQSIIGNINTEQPWAYQIKARAKWDAWKAVENIRKDVAMRMYVAEFEKQKQEFA